eukprot:gnl/TRDRNA2_/TRDRNA2_3497_c0_seq1.p1 gnl/TRDRNA2_/TRDRNA2_3497_c0~~gnl/TRDRNA2_/TRDRNA2_3497_c0_seq1.p1  ORF type:complete len:124 (-),score=29.57 gnl/TRDRNA2_/TRDRNA2_3497_c0_seq1:91-414(-)
MPPDEKSGMNPFKVATGFFKKAQNLAKGEELMVGGGGGMVALKKVPEKVAISLGGAELGSGRPYVGEFPGLTKLGGLGADAGPAAVLGSDVLRQRKRLVLRDFKVYV